MCTIIPCNGRCTHAPAGSSIPGPLTVLVAILAAAWLALRYVVAPAAVVAAWWLSGGHVLTRRPRRYARRVHAAGRITLTAALVALLAWPAATGAALVALGLALAVTATVRRDQTRQAARAATATRPPIRTRAHVRRPVAAVTNRPPAERFARTSSTGYRVRP